ncbi:MAG TPA: glycosyltransferase, partial [Cryobacterium sp.]|nr:glycosyltransferase [Cryobacterium sp.]
EQLEARYPVPVRVVYNGFGERTADVATAPDPSGGLVIAHLGLLYRGRRDPTPLFRAVRALEDDARRVRLEFYGPDVALVERLARKEGVASQVHAHLEVPYAESLAIQARADALLLLMWEHPEEEGVLPGKLFEYMGAGRPVLAVGAGEGAAARLIADRGLGLASSDPAAITAQLRVWLREKDASGRVPPLPEGSTAEFARAHQVRRLADFFSSVVAARDR